MHIFNVAQCKEFRELGWSQEPEVNLPSMEETIKGGFYWVGKPEGECALTFYRDFELEGVKDHGYAIVKMPTLTEMIKVIRDFPRENDQREGFYLERMYIHRFGRLTEHWRASMDMDWRQSVQEMGENDTSGYGPTAEHACIDLWKKLL